MSVVSENIKAILSEIPLDISVEKRIERLAGMEAVDRGFVAEHAMGVASTASEIAKSIGMSEREVDDLAYAVRWHDLGKLAIPDEILRKPARLDDDEFAIMKSHTEAGLVLMGEGVPSLLRDVVLYHHERYDGNGYNGLKGEEIPLSARITAIADVHDALMEKRDYKAPLTEERTLELMTRDDPGFGRYAFDPFLLRKFVSLRLADTELRLSDEISHELMSFATSDPMLDIKGGWEANDGWRIDRNGNRIRFEQNEDGHRRMVEILDPAGKVMDTDRVFRPQQPDRVFHLDRPERTAEVVNIANFSR
jgi:HD-GYP domain-containing protein (c-di-GMP phosphodiesterase class II)